MKQKVITYLVVAILCAAVGYAVFTSEWLYVSQFSVLLVATCVLGTVGSLAAIAETIILNSEK